MALLVPLWPHASNPSKAATTWHILSGSMWHIFMFAMQSLTYSSKALLIALLSTLPRETALSICLVDPGPASRFTFLAML